MGLSYYFGLDLVYTVVGFVKAHTVCMDDR